MEGRLEALLGDATYVRLRAMLTQIIDANARDEQP
jgi:hypothetical protein